MTDRQRIIDKIRKLLNLSESVNIHEAALAATTAQRLLAEHNLKLSDITAESAHLRATRESRKTRQRLEKWAFALAFHTARSFDCDYYHRTSDGQTVFIGLDPAPEICGWMYHYLYKTLLRLASAHMRGPSCKRLRAAHSKKKARDSYLKGAVDTIAERLMEQKKQTPPTPGALAPSVQAAIRAAMPSDIKTSTVRIGGLRLSDYAAGEVAAGNIPLSKPLRGGCAPHVLEV